MMTAKPKLGIVTKTGEIRPVIWQVKGSWTKKVSFMKIIQVVFGVMSMLALIFGLVFLSAAEWRASAVSLAIASFALFVLWEFEHMECFYLRHELALVKKSKNENP